ncbi:MAG: SIS domain-containing protein [Deltaproteobacteria bacterium]|nr:SIS domain-containing protein [Deltaproteobacteria bacterium]
MFVINGIASPACASADRSSATDIGGLLAMTGKQLCKGLSIFRQLRVFLYRLIDSLTRWRIFIGRNPQYLPPNSIVIFPLLPNTFFCGIAGILTIKQKNQIKDGDIIEKLFYLFEKIKAGNVKNLLTQSIYLEGYLGGRDSLRDIEKYILYLKQCPYFEHIFFQPNKTEQLDSLSRTINSFLLKEEGLIEKNASNFSTEEMEYINNSLTLLKDSAWALERDILSNIDKILYLSGSNRKEEISKQGFKKYKEINFLLNSLDRLEIRGRDSAGIQITLDLKDKNSLGKVLEDLKKEHLYDDFLKRLNPGDLLSGSIHLFDNTKENGRPSLTFTYKKASITGELGDNSSFLRNAIRSDQMLKAFINKDAGSELYLAHTRWASVGSINEENCHPIDNFTLNTEIDTSSDIPLPIKEYPYYGRGAWSINVALNGDIDNYTSLRASMEAEGGDIIDSSVTTDTKIIPLQIERYLYEGYDLKEAFRLAATTFEGSHAIAMQSNLEPGKVFLALKGSGQSLYVGLCDDQYIFSSEIYGLVDLTPYFIKMDGENERIPGDQKTKGQIFILSRDKKDTSKGINAFYYDGYPLEITEENIQKAEITTRDIDRKDFPHYLLKEIFDAPSSVRKTLRGKYRISHNKDGSPSVTFNLGGDIIPKRLKDALLQGEIKNISVIGQGTAAVAGAAIADALSKYLKGIQIRIDTKKASDLSGFFLDDNLNNTLVIAVTQSGTTTDTNRAVAMAKERGAYLIAIVNRRQSDITNKTDGVFYTSDGRDIEMSVASTKAFYSQITAGYVLALYMAKLLGALPDDRIARELTQLEKAPALMRRVIGKKESIRQSAWDLVRRKKYWAVVGSGTNKVASDEIRIKLSELCYKTISSDIIEDKKHIDLSAEPLIIVLSTGSPEFVLEDIVKDVEIFKAHASSVVVIADKGEARFNTIADSVITVPKSSFPMSVILNTLAGHIWGYYAACSLDELSGFFKNFRMQLSGIVSEHEKKGYSIYETIADKDFHRVVKDFSSEYKRWRSSGILSTLSVETASDITLLLKHAVGKLPIEDFWEDFEDRRVSSSPIDMLDITLGKAIDELSRPIDAIRHQAKTVTVGTSRKTEVLRGVLFDLLKKLGFSLENLSSKNGLSLKNIQKAVSGINGYTLYEINGLDEEGMPSDISTISIVKRCGVSRDMRSRVEGKAPLAGTKRTIVRTGDVYAGGGRADNASIVIIPLLGSEHIIENLLLAHVKFNDKLSVPQKKGVLGDKFTDIRNLINEYNLSWNDDCLEALSIKFLLGEAVETIAGEIKVALDKG